MKILIITQKVDENDQNLGFFHNWIKEFSKYCDVKVICLYKGNYDLPGVSVYSLGKEKGQSRIKYIWNFYKYIFTLDYDCVFVHMNPIYVSMLLFSTKPIYLWYTHKKVNTILRIALLKVKKVFTASKESFRIKNKKVKVMGHGIDTDLFVPGNFSKAVISIGRISKTKRLDQIKAEKLILVGGPITKEDEQYALELKKNPNIEFVGPVKPKEVINWLHKANVFVNTSNTGSLDKAVLEAMSCGLNIVTTNEAFPGHIKIEDMAKEIENNIDKPLNMKNREYVIENHNLKKLIPKLVEEMK